MNRDSSFLEDLCDALEVELGGPAELARTIAQDYKEADTGSATRLRAGMALIDLFKELHHSDTDDSLDELKKRYAKLQEQEDTENRG